MEVKNELYREEISMKLDKLSNVSEEILKQLDSLLCLFVNNH